MMILTYREFLMVYSPLGKGKFTRDLLMKCCSLGKLSSTREKLSFSFYDSLGIDVDSTLDGVL